MSAATQDAPYAVIVGLGTTGLSCARYLRAHGWRVAVTDTRAAPPQLPALTALDARIPLRLGGLDPSLLAEALDVPRDWAFVGYLCVGWPQEEHLTPELERAGWQARTEHPVIRR